MFIPAYPFLSAPLFFTAYHECQTLPPHSAWAITFLRIPGATLATDVPTP